MRKAFTLIEVMMSITIFSILILFLYKTLDQTKLTNKLFTKKVQASINLNYAYDVIVGDMALSINTPKSSFDDETNSRIVFKSNNTYHNAFYTNIAYMINSLNQLVRIESAKAMSLSAETPPNFEFYQESYIDVLFNDVEYFEVQQNKKDIKNYLFVIKQKSKEALIFNTFRFNNTITAPSSGGSSSEKKDEVKK